MSTRRVLAGLAAIAAVSLMGQGLAAADAPPAVHRGNLVPEMPQKSDVAGKIVGLQVDGKLTGKIQAIERIGQRILVGGSFSSVQLPDGTVTPQPNLAAFDVDTGEFDAGFRPVVDGEVVSIQKGDTQDTAFIGGRFKNVGPVGATLPRKSLAKISTVNGAPDPKWVANAWGVVSAMATHADELYVGGDFLQIGGKARTRLARLSVSTGAVDDKWTIGIEGVRNQGYRFDNKKGKLISASYDGATVRAMKIGPEGGTLWVAHRGEMVGGQKRVGLAKIYTGYGNRTDGIPEVTNWSTSLWDTYPTGEKVLVMLQDMDLSPDGSTIVTTSNGNNFPPYYDSVVAFATKGSGERKPKWVTQNFDSTYAVAISDAAVYVGGHFCWTESEAGTTDPASWPGKSGGVYSCYSKSAEQFAPETSFHYHLAALSLQTGRAFDAWKGSSTNSRNGVTELKVIDRGLLVGHDGTSFGRKTSKTEQQAIETGAFGFFDLGADYNS